jgi:hypothetical protein
MKTANAILVTSTLQNLLQNEISRANVVHKNADINSGHFRLYLSLKCPQTSPIMPFVKVNTVPVTSPNYVCDRFKPFLIFFSGVEPTCKYESTKHD